MRIRYLQDHPVRPLHEWTGKQSLDWLHPCHGPLPNKMGAICCDEDEYLVCLWLLEERIVTVTELVDVSDVNEGWGNRAEKRGWIMHSLNWSPTKDGFSCEDQYVKVPEILRRCADPEQEEALLRDIMTRSVRITRRTPLGAPVVRMHDTPKG